MATIHITKDAADLIRAAAVQPFKETGRPHADGLIEIDLADEVFDRLTASQHFGETYSDTIIRLCTLARSGGRMN